MDANTLSNRIRETRRALNLTQAQLAAAAGVGVRFIGELEAGKPTVQLGRTLAVMDALGLVLEIRPSAR